MTVHSAYIFYYAEASADGHGHIHSLTSFAKYLELLIYSPAIHALQPPLCEHTALPGKPWSPADLPVPRARFNILRRFSHKGRIVTLTLTEVKDIFEVKVPRLQILRRKGADKKPAKGSPEGLGPPSALPSEERRALRREILRWWQGLSEHMDQLVRPQHKGGLTMR